MVRDVTAVVAAAAPHRGIGCQGQMVRAVQCCAVLLCCNCPLLCCTMFVVVVVT